MNLIPLMLAGLMLLGEVPTTRPTDANPRAMETAELETRAQIAFAAGDHATALPMLKVLAVRLRNDPDRTAPILEQVRVSEAALAANPPAVEGFTVERTPHVRPAEGQVLELSLQQLGNFRFDPDKGVELPSDVVELNESTVRLRGYMLPTIEAGDKISEFVLVADLFACCFGQPPQVQHTVTVRTPAGKSVSYYQDEIIVTGKLKVGVEMEDGFVTSVFHLDPTSVKPAPQ
jgi:hypothetical protein